jgi:hypothetical protein
MSLASTKKKQSAAARPLVVNRLENVSKDVFKKYYPLITKLVGDSPGIYALYDGVDLYYVGKSTELRKRVRHHLIDRHLASWTHFSLYLVRREEHIHEFESLLVRIANPKGNRVIPRGKSTGVLVDQLKKMIQLKQKEELGKLFGTKNAAGRKVPKSSQASQRTIEGLVAKRTELYRTYKGKEYKAALSPKGVITYAGQSYKSPSAAARAVIVRKGAVNGWTFWYIKSSSGDWVRLMDYEG